MFSKPKTKSDFSEKKKSARGAKPKRYRMNLLIAGLFLVAFCFSMIIFSGRGSQAASAQSSNGISDAAAQQIQALLSEKESRNAAQKKIDSQLIYATKQARGQAVASGVPTLQTRVEVDKANQTVVDIVTSNLKATQTKLAAANISVLNAMGSSIRA